MLPQPSCSVALCTAMPKTRTDASAQLRFAGPLRLVAGATATLELSQRQAARCGFPLRFGSTLRVSGSGSSSRVVPKACDVSLLINGGFSPLTGFMKQADYNSVAAEPDKGGGGG